MYKRCLRKLSSEKYSKIKAIIFARNGTKMVTKQKCEISMGWRIQIKEIQFPCWFERFLKEPEFFSGSLC